jgi:dTDP-4-dehydrorhamnose 3,5-epimerase
MDPSAVNTATIAGVTATPLRVIADGRGAVLHMLRADAADFTVFGECYFSEVNPGSLKAWKRHRLQSQKLAVPVGRVRIVVRDDREGSASRGQVDIFELGRPDAYYRLHIPSGLWYGFHGLAGTPSLLANCADAPHDPAESELVAADDPAFSGALRWLQGG